MPKQLASKTIRDDGHTKFIFSGLTGALEQFSYHAIQVKAYTSTQS